jgi:hypothetical protein
MSFARFGADSNVYVYASDRGITCCSCWLNDGKTVDFANARLIRRHLIEHKLAGHFVLDQTFNEIRKYRLENEEKTA